MTVHGSFASGPAAVVVGRGVGRRDRLRELLDDEVSVVREAATKALAEAGELETPHVCGDVVSSPSVLWMIRIR